MKPFDSLTVAGQARRIRRLAETALPRFGFAPGVPLVFINHGENTTFRVEDPVRGRFLLRVHRSGYQSDAEIKSELEWLLALRRDTDVLAPCPVRGTDGRATQHATARGVPDQRTVTLLHWIDGRFRTEQSGLANHRRIGALTAHLHDHARSWSRPPDFQRRTWDADGLLGAEAHFGSTLAVPGLTRDERRHLGHLLARIKGDLHALDKGPDSFGLIHADLHLANVLVRGGVACPIDFDDAGFGWLAYDWAVTMTWSLGHPGARAAMDAWLEGYEAVRPLPPSQRAALDLFVVARALAMVGWAGSRADNARILASLRPRLRRTLLQGAAYVEGRPLTDVEITT